MTLRKDGGPGPQLVRVYAANGHPTSGGNGPGVKLLPPAEAASLVGRRLAIHGDQPPRGFPR